MENLGLFSNKFYFVRVLIPQRVEILKKSVIIKTYKTGKIAPKLVAG